MDNSIFVFSLDLELIWGAINPPVYRLLTLLKKAGGVKLRACIHFLLDLFEKYKVSVTWAVVGHLFLDYLLEHKVQGFNMHYNNCLSSNNLVIRLLKKDPLLFYGKDIVDEIMSSHISHEIGYHSFSHPVFTSITREAAEMEIKMGVELAKKFGLTLNSFVFPKNEIAHVDLLKKYGFKIYRGKTAGRYDDKYSFLRQKAYGLINKIISSPVMPKWENGIWMIPASIYFCDPQIPFTLTYRAKLGLRRAIYSNQVFHVFIHPWNLLSYKFLHRDIEFLLKYVAKERDAGRIKIMTLSQLANFLNKKYIRYLGHNKINSKEN